MPQSRSVPGIYPDPGNGPDIPWSSSLSRKYMLKGMDQFRIPQGRIAIVGTPGDENSSFVRGAAEARLESGKRSHPNLPTSGRSSGLTSGPPVCPPMSGTLRRGQLYQQDLVSFLAADKLVHQPACHQDALPAYCSGSKCPPCSISFSNISFSLCETATSLSWQGRSGPPGRVSGLSRSPRRP